VDAAQQKKSDMAFGRHRIKRAAERSVASVWQGHPDRNLRQHCLSVSLLWKDLLTVAKTACRHSVSEVEGCESLRGSVVM